MDIAEHPIRPVVPAVAVVATFLVAVGYNDKVIAYLWIKLLVR